MEIGRWERFACRALWIALVGFGCNASEELESAADASGGVDASAQASCADLSCQQGATCEVREAGPVCVDVDECALSLHDCSETERCINTRLGFTCFDATSPCVTDPCQAGYDCVEVDAATRQCIDQDECAIEGACPASADCVEEEGATQPLCVDRAQCSNGEHDCDLASELCIELETAPGFRCRPRGAGDAGTDAIMGAPDATTGPTYPRDGFCSTGEWAFCEDFDGVGSADKSSLSQLGISYVSHGAGTTGSTSFFPMNCTVSSPCDPFMENGALHTISDDGDFGAVVFRPRRPFDFSAAGGGHLRFESDLALTGTNRKHLAIRITDEVTLDFPDVRVENDALSMRPALEIVFLGGQDSAVWGRTWQNAKEGNYFGSGWGKTLKPGQTQTVDIYVQRNHIRVTVDGVEFINDTIPDLGFGVGYIHFGHLSYNPSKDNSHPTRADNILMFDNIAFDGPVLPENGLTPAGSQEAVFFTDFTRKWFGDAEEKAAPVECFVRGVKAEGPPNARWEHYTVWSGTVAGGAPLTASDIDCHGSPVLGLEVVTQP